MCIVCDFTFTLFDFFVSHRGQFRFDASGRLNPLSFFCFFVFFSDGSEILVSLGAIFRWTAVDYSTQSGQCVIESVGNMYSEKLVQLDGQCEGDSGEEAASGYHVQNKASLERIWAKYSIYRMRKSRTNTNTYLFYCICVVNPHFGNTNRSYFESQSPSLPVSCS